MSSEARAEKQLMAELSAIPTISVGDHQEIDSISNPT